MKLLSPLLFILLITISCKGQKEELEKESPRTTLKQSKIDSLPHVDKTDFDPYYDPTTTVTSSKGPTSITRNVIQDQKGNYWLATWEGMIRYDGKTFTNLTNRDSLRRHRYFTILEDSKGRIWYGTIGAGVYLVEGDAYTNFTTKDGLLSDKTTCIFEDQKGNIWFGTTKGISVYNGKQFKNYTTDDGLSSNDVNSIVADASGKFWIGTRGNACVFDGKKFTELVSPTGDPFVNVRTIIKDRDHNMWLGGNNGLWKFSVNYFTNFSKNFIGYIFEDKEGNIWTNSESDFDHEWVLTKYPRNFLNSPVLQGLPMLQEADMFFGITQDQKGDIWFGSLNGIVHYDGTTFNRYR